jgi:hypothetical protein
MKMKKILISFVTLIIVLTLSSCQTVEEPTIELKVTQMKSISELAVLDVYYHNVAKYIEEDASGFWFWKKDKNIWVEYSGIVKIGIDASLLELSVEGDTVTITLPDAQILDTKVDEDSLTADSFIIAVDSAKVTAADVTKAIGDAQAKMRGVAEQNTTLIDNANQRVKKLLSDYVDNIGQITGIDYKIVWQEIE